MYVCISPPTVSLGGRERKRGWGFEIHSHTHTLSLDTCSGGAGAVEMRTKEETMLSFSAVPNVGP